MSVVAGHSKTNRASLELKAVAAFLGTAFGDALGWPYEGRARRVGKRDEFDPSRFEEWIKRSGGRFLPHDENIRAGEYSDDTQLTLAVARSLLARREWWRDLAFVELPWWSAYERGGGGATKRAVARLLDGQCPWQGKAKDIERYFTAGGNGVAMRVLPHAVHQIDEPNFDRTAWSVLVDGVCTHGHPRALVGAIAFAYALRTALLHSGTLSYGALIDGALDGFSKWSPLPSISDAWPDWRKAAQTVVPDYEARWATTAQEMRELLEICHAGLGKGALAVDRMILEKLGCFDKRQNGAGTVTAAAAIFLASRHASSPRHGLASAATATGADTDTIASMMAALLGAIAGDDWMYPGSRELQDQEYIRHIASELLSSDPPNTQARAPVTSKVVRHFLDHLASAQTHHVALPDGRRASLLGAGSAKATGANVNVVSWHLKTDDGQVLYLKKITKGQREATRPQSESLFSTAGQSTFKVTRVGLQLWVDNLSASKRFYQTVGLQITRETPNSVNFGGVLALRALRDGVSELSHAPTRPVIFLEVRNIEGVHRELAGFRGALVDEIRIVQGRAMFSCTDPDGYKLDFFEAERSAP